MTGLGLVPIGIAPLRRGATDEEGLQPITHENRDGVVAEVYHLVPRTLSQKEHRERMRERHPWYG